MCCGTKREVEIDCPGSCPYLQAGRSFESEKRVPDAQLVAQMDRYDVGFVKRHTLVLDVVNRAILEERMASPWLVDNDVLEVYKALAATMKTLSSGIYYETLPEGAVRISLFRRLKAALDELMKPSLEVQQALRASESVDVLEFLTVAAAANSSLRPRSRQYLDWLSQMAGAPTTASETSRLIVP